MKKDNEKPQPVSELTMTGEFKTSSLALALQQFKKEAEKKEAADEAAKVRCRVCFKEIAPTRRCSGHGGGGGGGGSGGSDGGSGKASEDKASPIEGKTLTKPGQFVAITNTLIGEFGFMENDEKLDSKSSFDPEIIAELIDKGLLLVDSNRESMTLNIKLLCKPNVLTEEQREELKKFMETIMNELHEFKEENNLSDDCMHVILDEEGNIRSLRITMPTLALYDAFIQRLANNLVPIPSPKVQEKDEVRNDKNFAPNPFSMEPKFSPSTPKEKVEENNEINEKEEEQEIFNPSPFKMSP